MVTLWATGDVITAARLNDYNCQSISIKPSTIGASAITIRDTGDTADKIILREDGSIYASNYGNINSLKIGGTDVITSGRLLQNIASIAQNLLPDADATRDLGSSSYRWKDLHLAGSIHFPGDIVSTTLRFYGKTGVTTKVDFWDWAFIEKDGASSDLRILTVNTAGTGAIERIRIPKGDSPVTIQMSNDKLDVFALRIGGTEVIDSARKLVGISELGQNLAVKGYSLITDTLGTLIDATALNDKWLIDVGDGVTYDKLRFQYCNGEWWFYNLTDEKKIFSINTDGDIVEIGSFVHDIILNDAYQLKWSDVNLKRVAADILQTDDVFRALKLISNLDGSPAAGLEDTGQIWMRPAFADSVTTLRDSPPFTLTARYWDGTTSVNRDAVIYHDIWETTPRSTLVFQIAGVDIFKLHDDKSIDVLGELRIGEPMNAGNNAINFVSSLRGTYGPASAIEFPAGTGGRITINTPNSVGAITERMVFQGLVDTADIDIVNANIDMNGTGIFNVSKITLGPGGDVLLERFAANELRLSDLFIIQRASGTDHALIVRTGDVYPNLRVLADGTIEWGDGTTTPDTNLHRKSANVLATDDTLDLRDITLPTDNTYNWGIWTDNKPYSVNTHRLKAIYLNPDIDQDLFVFLHSPTAPLRTLFLGKPPDANATTTTLDSPRLGFQGTYWDGTMSQTITSEAQLEVLDTAPTTKFRISVPPTGDMFHLYSNYDCALRATFRPWSDNLYDLGSTSFRWKDGYIVNLYTGDITLDNGMVITEDSRGVIFKSPRGEELMKLDMEGNLYVKGEIRQWN